VDFPSKNSLKTGQKSFKNVGLYAPPSPTLPLKKGKGEKPSNNEKNGCLCPILNMKHLETGNDI